MAGIYIHIPFCKQACHYCNFHFTTSLRYKAQLVNAIANEIMLAKKEAFIPDDIIETIYLGGGTPSLLTDEELKFVIDAIQNNFKVAPDAEITLEANPDDINKEKLESWIATGINRLSIGVQSFFDEDLQWMNRAHNAAQAIKSLELALQYFNDISIDLIYGVPGLTDEHWKMNVDKAVSFGIPHISCYALTVEKQTPLDKMINTHKKQDVDPGKQSDQFLLLMDWLQAAGYEHYEISNFAKKGKRSRHNSSYWKGLPYWGFGPAAHSFNGNVRRWNVANNQQYIQSINNEKIPYQEEPLTAMQKRNEYIMIALRTIEGIDLNYFSIMQQERILTTATNYLQQGLIVLSKQYLRLTQRGKLFADGIAADFFDVV